MKESTRKKNLPSTISSKALRKEEIQKFFNLLGDGWENIDNKKIQKTYSFDDFKSGLSFVQDLGKIAEEQNHHPDLLLTWGKVLVTLWTHKVKGLTENDFTLASRFDVAYAVRFR